MKKEFVENGAIYITNYSSFQKTKCRISGKIGLYIMPSEVSYQIDTLEEFNIIEDILKNKKKF